MFKIGDEVIVTDDENQWNGLEGVIDYISGHRVYIKVTNNWLHYKNDSKFCFPTDMKCLKLSNDIKFNKSFEDYLLKEEI